MPNELAEQCRCVLLHAAPLLKQTPAHGALHCCDAMMRCFAALPSDIDGYQIWLAILQRCPDIGVADARREAH